MEKHFQLAKAQTLYLRKIGLSKDAIRLYELLLRRSSLSAKEAGAHLQSFASATYRLFYELEERGLVLRLPGRPRRFEVLPIEDGLPISLSHQENELKALMQVESGGGELVRILVGRQEVYDAYTRQASAANNQICIYAIGIAYSDNLARTQAAAIERGVRIRHVVQEVKAANFFVVSRWLKLGIALRTLRRPRGYHLTVIDDSCAIVTFSNPDNTEERISMMTTNKSVVAILQAQFESIWQAAKAVPPGLLG